MSYYPIFDEVEPTITTTTTNALAVGDVMLIHSSVTSRKAQVPVGQITAGPQALQSLTSATTATNIVPFGITSIASSNALSYLLTAPTGAGIIKTITTSSTAVLTVVTSLASLSSTGAINGTQFILNSAGAAISGGSISLVSVGTTRWNTLAYSGTTILS